MEEEVRERLRSGEYRVKRKEGQAAKSHVWDNFCEVVSAVDDSSIGYVKCNSCDKLYKHESHKTDLRPFDIVSGDGFRAVAQSLINVGARYGRVDASSALPHRQTVCDRAKATATDKKEILAKEINKALDCGIAITTDMWTDDYNTRAYTAFTGHFVSEDCKLKSRVITTAEFDSTLKKTAYNLHEQVIEELHDFGIEPERLPKVMFVSDQAANINAALRSHKWMPCAAHVINIVLKHTFDVTPAYMHDVSHVIDKCKSLVTYLKKSSRGDRGWL
ncbi:Transposable element Hobo transposase [Solea senegalensis]|uniref:Transposable element Hobo transposase n=1 Tax=Solea senegalensis TaxID=28829 RepID=A0AAV6PD01_SOLSE|nr:Transposable element Hobo transposase [Solea senegalensis]